jgi:hypothetical protein
MKREIKLWCNNLRRLDKNSEGATCVYFMTISHISTFGLKRTPKTLLMTARNMEESKCGPLKLQDWKVTATSTCSIRYSGKVFSSLSFILFLLHLVISLIWIACWTYERRCAASLAALLICTCWWRSGCVARASLLHGSAISFKCPLLASIVTVTWRYPTTTLGKWKRCCYINIQTHGDEMHIHDTKDNIKLWCTISVIPNCCQQCVRLRT